MGRLYIYIAFLFLILVFFKLIYIGRCFYARDPRGETFTCVVLVLALGSGVCRELYVRR
jgi:hypothetical protein